MKDFRIEIGETIRINDVEIYRINRLYYYVNGDKDVKCKKSAALEVINNKETHINGNVDWSYVNKCLKLAGKEQVELYNEQIVIDHTNKDIWVDGDGIVDTYEYDENGEQLFEASEDIKDRVATLIDEIAFRTGIEQDWNNMPTLKNYTVRLYNNKHTSNEIFKHFINDYDSRLEYVYIDHWGDPLNTACELLRSKIQIVHSWFLDKHYEGFGVKYISSSVENHWKTHYKDIYNKIYQQIKDCKNKKDLEVELDKWINTNKFKWVHEIERIRQAEQEYAWKSQQEANKRRDEWFKNYFNQATESKEDLEIKEMVKGMTYKQACRFSHPDISKLENAQEVFQTIQKHKDKWFDVITGKWVG